jgi:hypothetical protein
MMSLLPLLGAACSDDYSDPATNHGSNRLSVPYRVDGEMSLSRGMIALDHEKAVDHAYILFFEESGDNANNYATSARMASSGSRLEFPIPEDLKPDTRYLTLVVANADSYLPSGMTDFNAHLSDLTKDMTDKTRENFAAVLTAHFTGQLTASNPGLLPMWGRFTDNSGKETAFTFSRSGGEAVTCDGEFFFSRSLSRIDMLNLVPDKLEVAYVKVCNYRDAGLIFHDGLNAGSVVTLKKASDAPKGDGGDGYITVNAPDAGKNVQRLEASLYAFPNVVNTCVQNDRSTTCLIIAGYFTEDGKERDTELTYYRFNLANVGESQVLKRNYAYTAVIKGVKRRGASTDYGAYDDKMPIFEYDVDDEWQITDDNYVSDADGNFIVVSKSHLTFSGEASEAENIELRVSTSPKMTWELAPVNEPGNENDKFQWSKLSDEALKVGPRENNATQYVRFGYLQVVATNTETGKQVKMPIYLQQLSLKYDIKMLTVNGNTGTFTQELPPSGGAVYLRVVTGGNTNNWVAVDVDNEIESWDKDATWTKRGGNNTELMISVPANISGNERTATLRISLDPKDDNVLPVTILLHQGTSDQWFAISPQPGADGVSIDAFSTIAGYPNGVVPGTSRGFRVTLTNKSYRFKVTTSFNQGRDVRLSKNVNLEGRNAQSTHEEFTPEPLEDLESGTMFYINPFRTGPNDPTIKGTVTVTVYDPANPTIAKEETFGVNITSGPSLLYDVVIDDILVADRNIGHQSRMTGEDGKPFMVRNFYESDMVKIYSSGADLAENINSSYNDSGKRYDPGSDWNEGNGEKIYTTSENQISAVFGKLSNAAVDWWKNYHLDPEQTFSAFYKTDTKWNIPSTSQMEKIKNNVRFSKWRIFLVSDIGEGIVNMPVVCWLHQTKCKICPIGSNNELREVFGAYVYFPSGADLQMMYINNTNSDFVFSNSISNYMQFVYYGYPNASIRLVHPLAATEKGDDGTYAKSLKAYYDRTQ